MVKLFYVFYILLLLSEAVESRMVHPDFHLCAEDMIKKYGYPVEIHEVTTMDGYMLTMFRIPHGKKGKEVNQKPILLMHGLFGQAENYIIAGMNNASLAYFLADNGFDVWLGNTRGSQHGRQHKTMDPNGRHFWDFSYHEIGVYDLPAKIDYILQKTSKEKIHYIGHSQGGTTFYIMTSEKPEYQRKIVMATLLAPAGYMNHFANPLLLPLVKTYRELTVQLVKKYGYPLEIHSVITQDGYNISIYRIPHGKNGNTTNRKPLLMMHGIASQAESFIINGVNNGSWAYFMADHGYDVWLGNTRGTPHGRKHLFLDTKQKEFWNFSFHEIGLYDLPAIIDYVIEKTNKPKLSYVATSQGCTIFYVMCSYRREYQKKIIIASFLAPAGYMKHFSYPLILPFTRTPKRMQLHLEDTGFYEFFPEDLHVHQLLEMMCGFVVPDFCVKIFHILAGGETGEFNDEMLPLAVKFGTSVSLYQILHFVQLINSGHFRPFDHGEEKNIEIYGKPVPDDYPIETIDVPIAMYYSIGDSLIKYKDIEEMCDALPMCVRQFILPNKRWNHLDFVYSVHLTKELIEPVAKFAENYETKYKNFLCNKQPEPREMENAECIKSVYN